MILPELCPHGFTLPSFCPTCRHFGQVRAMEQAELQALPSTASAGDSGSDQMPARGTADDRYSRGRHGPTISLIPPKS